MIHFLRSREITEDKSERRKKAESKTPPSRRTKDKEVRRLNEVAHCYWIGVVRIVSKALDSNPTFWQVSLCTFVCFFLLEGKSDVLVKGLMALRGQVLVLPAFAFLAASNLSCLLRCAPRLHSSTFCGEPPGYSTRGCS